MSDDIRQKYTIFKKTLLKTLEKSEKIADLAGKYPSDNKIQKTFSSSSQLLLKELYKSYYHSSNLVSFTSTIQNTLQRNLPDLKKQIDKLQEGLDDTDKILNDFSELQTAHRELEQYSEDNLQSFAALYNEDKQLFDYILSRMLFLYELFQYNVVIHNITQDPTLLKNAEKWLEEYPKQRDDIISISSKKSEVEVLEKQLKNLYSDCEKCRKEIEGLRQNAIKIGLAEHYNEKSEDLYKYQKRWTWTILGGLAVLLCLGIYNYFTKQETNSLEHLFHLLSIFPAYLALIWFIIFASRRRNEISRLSNDYSHKAVFASSYLAYQEQIEELKKTNQDTNIINETTQLKIKLLDSMIDTLADNPAKSLDNKKASDELPAKEIINFASEIIKLKDSKGGK